MSREWLAQTAVAKNMFLVARQAWERHDFTATGEKLESSLEHHAAAVDWSRGGTSAPKAETYREWVELAGMLHRGETGWSEDHVRSMLADFNAELSRLDWK